MHWEGVIAKYHEFLPLTAKTPYLTLLEGNTPLILGENISKDFGSAKIYFKYEGLNPTGSFKDRGMVMAVAKAVEDGAKAIICASTGNTSAAAAAYAARAGLDCFVLIPEGKIALGKLAQALMYGAKVIALQGNFDEALQIVREIGSEYPVTVVNSVNPYRIEGQKTAAFEVCDALESEAPDYLAIPVGNAGNITAYWKGFKEYKSIGKISRLPKMIGFQAAGAAPIVENRVIEKPNTVATAIRIGNPASWQGAKTAIEESNGEIHAVTDEEILAAQKELAEKEGIFAEPASAASYAGVKKLYAAGKLQNAGKIVCVLTGHGLKDPDTAIAQSPRPFSCPAEKAKVLELIFG